MGTESSSRETGKGRIDAFFRPSCEDEDEDEDEAEDERPCPPAGGLRPSFIDKRARWVVVAVERTDAVNLPSLVPASEEDNQSIIAHKLDEDTFNHESMMLYNAAAHDANLD
ncbi:hypothetical protein SAMD00023353_3201120 [Rosellinia necatrix]|uniref:Uncharacterized protein n=1 Tax=Rosellinia necatrix TaxID=77044 RepID=A0A1W2TIQ0_ROSNE|nr:hypothetical protein SAMD00023353_3201120 [Rosellinia necatrix]